MKTCKRLFAASACAILTTLLCLTSQPTALADTTWEPVYATDFTTDPGWGTSAPGSYFWNPGAGNYTLTMVGGSESYVTNPVSLNVTQSFKLEFDISISSMDNLASINFGLWAATPPGQNGPGDHPHLLLEFAIGPGGNLLMVEGYDATDYFIQFYQYPSGWALGAVYHAVVIYDHDAGTVTGLVTNKTDGQLLWSGSQSGVHEFGGVAYLGASKIGDAVTPGATGIATIDNLSLEQPGGGSTTGGAIPTVTASGPAQAELGTAVVVNATVQDADNDALTVQWLANGQLAETVNLAAGTTASPVGLSFTNTLPVGVNSVTVVVTDTSNNTAQFTIQITVTDTQPPVINSVTATPNVLWPPDRRWRAVNIAVDARDFSSFTWSITQITSNETAPGRGRSHACRDAIIAGPHKALLRAERSGRGSGRIYTITIEATDAFNNTSTGTVQVTVPRDMGHRKAPVLASPKSRSK